MIGAFHQRGGTIKDEFFFLVIGLAAWQIMEGTPYERKRYM
jgi:hypothetical protein